MIKILNFFANILSFVINPIYDFTKDYGLAVILFTLIIKLILFPLGIKQQKKTVKTKKIRPELERIQAKYKNDKEKLNEETMKLYQKYGVNPMGGCLPLLIQLPILLAFYRVIQAPVTWFLRITPALKLDDMVKKGEMMDAQDIVDLLSINLIGAIPDDENVIIQTNKGEPSVTNPKSLSGKAYMETARRILGEDIPVTIPGKKEGFMEKLKKMFSSKK